MYRIYLFIYLFIYLYAEGDACVFNMDCTTPGLYCEANQCVSDNTTQASTITTTTRPNTGKQLQYFKNARGTCLPSEFPFPITNILQLFRSKFLYRVEGK